MISDRRLISVISKTDKAGTLRSDSLAVNRSAKHRLGERRDRTLLLDDRERENSDGTENNNPDANKRVSVHGRKKQVRPMYAARVLGDLKLVKDNSSSRGIKSEVNDSMGKQASDTDIRISRKRKKRLESPGKIKSLDKSKSVQKSKKKDNYESDVSSDEMYKKKKKKKDNTACKDIEKSDSSFPLSSADYVPSQTRKLKSKKKKKGL